MESNRESSVNMVDIPQLVLEKIMSYLNHKELLALERVSRKFNIDVNAHFSVMSHLILGSLPEVNIYDDYGDFEVSAKNKKKLDGLLSVINRCGTRLRTVQITVTDQFRRRPLNNYIQYLKCLFESVEVGGKCPNIENIITSPNMEYEYHFHDIFNQRKLAISQEHTDIYADKVKQTTGLACKLRSMTIIEEAQEHQYQHLLFLYSNLEQIIVYELTQICLKNLPLLIENGLKHFKIVNTIDFKDAKTLLNIGKDLETLMIAVRVNSYDDVASLNKLRLHKNTKLKIEIMIQCFAMLKKNICTCITNCDIYGPVHDYSSMAKLHNLEEFDIKNSEELKVLAEGSFAKLKKIKIRYFDRSCELALTTYLPQLLINKGKQLTVIDIGLHCQYSLNVVWTAVKYCQAAKSIKLYDVVMDASSNITYEDVKAICQLRNLQHFMVFIPQSNYVGFSDAVCMLRGLMEKVVTEHMYFQFDYELDLQQISSTWDIEHIFTLDRINF